jgi:uncharacterized protein (TIRG00374 family)
MARAVQIALVIGGAALLVLLVRAIGLTPLVEDLRRFGVGLVVVVAFELLLDACNTLGWRHTLVASPRVGFWSLYWIRQAGTAVNQLTPTAMLGGEVVKAMLLRPHLPMADALASLLAAKVSFAIAQTALVLLGLASILSRLHDAPRLALGVVLSCITTFTAVLAFLLLQRRGMFATLAGFAWRLGLRTAFVARVRAQGDALDARLVTFYRDRPGAFVRSVGWHFIAQITGLLQLVFILAWLGTPASIGTCLAIEAFALVVDSALFFVPARIGVQEGGRVVIFTALGLGAATGLAVALIVRLNQLIVTAVGLAAFGYLSLTTTPIDGSLSET